MVFKYTKTSILANRFRSSYFKISRSMRQGCPSCTCFTFYKLNPWRAENKYIKDIPLPHISPETGERKEAKINGYVDDSQLFISTEESINEWFKVLYCYEKPPEQK